MINFAEEKLAGKTNHKLFKADMIDLEVPNILHEYHNGKPFDVVVSLFGCIGYIIGRNNLEKVFQNFYDLVKEDGLVIVENFLLPDDFNPGSVHMHTHDGEDLKIARISKTKYKFPHPQNEDEQDQIELDFNFMVGKTHDESSVDHFVDVHHMQLYREEFVRQCAEKIGFKEFKALRVNRFRLLYVIKK
jgi:SAM-dependent methyltransferase